jgi:hypothetical protein
LAILNRLHDFVWEFLERGHKTNIISYFGHPEYNITLMQQVISLHDISMTKLLVLYGGEIVGLDYSKTMHAAKMKKTLEETRLLYVNEIEPLLSLKTEQSFRQLAVIWRSLAEAETNLTLKICYQQKSDKYLKQAQQLAKLQLGEQSQDAEKRACGATQPFSFSKLFHKKRSHSYSQLLDNTELTESLLGKSTHHDDDRRSVISPKHSNSMN